MLALRWHDDKTGTVDIIIHFFCRKRQPARLLFQSHHSHMMGFVSQCENSYHHMTCFVIENLKREITPSNLRCIFTRSPSRHVLLLTIVVPYYTFFLLSDFDLIFIFTIIFSLLLHEYSYLKIFNSNHRLQDV